MACTLARPVCGGVASRVSRLSVVARCCTTCGCGFLGRARGIVVRVAGAGAGGVHGRLFRLVGVQVFVNGKALAQRWARCWRAIIRPTVCVADADLGRKVREDLPMHLKETASCLLLSSLETSLHNGDDDERC